MIQDLLEDSDIDSEAMGAAASHQEDKESRARAIRTKVKAIAAFNPLPSVGRKNKDKNKQVAEKVDSYSKRAELLEFLKTRREDKIESWDKLQKGYGGDNLEKTPVDSEGRPLSPRSESAEDNPHCMLCGEVSTWETLQCRVCDRKYHRKCLMESGMYTEAEMGFFDRAKTSIGWSCLRCDNIFNLLTPSELDELSDDFDRLDVNKDASISLEEFLAHRRRLATQEEGRSLTEEDEHFERLQFRLLDADGGGAIEYSEYLKHAACVRLAARPQEELIELLTRREILDARQVFDALDRDADGHVTSGDAKLAYRSWYTGIFRTGLQEGGVSRDTVNDLGDLRASLLMDVGDNSERGVDWKEFLEHRAIYIISSRPNTTAALSEKEEK